jgi:hypothetical protein
MPSRRTRKATVAWIQPRIGGIALARPLNICWRADKSLMSTLGVATDTPCDFNSETRSCAAVVFGPERDSRMRWRAPLLAIHRAKSRPSPPRPPAMMYEALSGNV